MSNVCYLAKILIFLVVTACYCSLPGCYWLLLLIPTFSMNGYFPTFFKLYVIKLLLFSSQAFLTGGTETESSEGTTNLQN